MNRTLTSGGIHISLKNKLLIAFLCIGVIPSLTLGFMMYKKSELAIASLISDDIENVLTEASIQESLPLSFLEDKGATISLPSNLIGIDNHTFKLIGKEQLLSPFYIEKIESLLSHAELTTARPMHIMEIDTVYAGVLFDEKNERWIFHFNFANDNHKNLDVVGTIFIKFSLIIIVLSIGASIAISYNITYGITKLLTYTKRIERGDLEFEIKEITNDEIGLLTQSFNKMTYRLNKLINKTYRLELSESEARLKALQAQISPHFLYNALDTINWSLIENGDYKTSATLGALSEILRYSIGDFEKIVTVEEEIKQISNYLKVQKSRFEDRLQYEIEIDEAILKEALPKLLLQPIVENAVVHGVERNKLGGLICIRGYYEADQMVITITDNGNGITEAKLEELNNKFKESKKINPVDRTEHIGLVNVHERIKLLYGPSGKLSIESVYNEGTEITMTLGTQNKV